MDAGTDELTSPPASSSTSNDIGNFECNICFELAEDPVVTPCGHLYCWPCLYKWLQMHSHSHQCPVCKALIEQEKLVPIYGRGKTSSDPRHGMISEVDVPNRPAGQRPQTAPPPALYTNYFHQEGNGLVGGFVPVGTARNDFTFSGMFGGLFPFLNFQAQRFNYANPYGAGPGFPYWHPGSFHGGHPHGFHYHPHGFHYHLHRGQRRDSFMKGFLLIGLAVLIYLISV